MPELTCPLCNQAVDRKEGHLDCEALACHVAAKHHDDFAVHGHEQYGMSWWMNNPGSFRCQCGKESITFVEIIMHLQKNDLRRCCAEGIFDRAAESI